ncbi:MAG TPA: hypothetical protein VN803_02140 [Gemmatimonadales bacterium]|nr:hypothetical protein [Gemmatimonadales bacterium]
MVWALVWNSGTCRPDGMADQWSWIVLRSVVAGENPKQRELRGGE